MLYPSETQVTVVDPMEETLTYEAASARLEAIIARLDSGEAGLRETLDLCREGRTLVEFCAAELEAVGQGLEELRLDELVARLEGSREAASIFTTVRPCSSPRRIASSAPRARRARSRARSVSRCGGRRSSASRRHVSRRASIGVCTESTPSSETPRRMNGSTVAGSFTPPVLPQAATAPP